ncbi:molybdenum cofactor guanylyltransferase [Altererythrobacter sp. RZ02]|uniref:Molybdenum cofactor guanylyltransferase n=1 Tax=Pontixanthobacter rizhaonensis TaxID=2730337 RepID=A0A848QN08_9SPHN|nr:molybdenum cofactor guanylyltransferase [Pontixanthobacter rizhaonensis]NMW32544.1 molybdenum cofactor guanylyltransferase [Pontixanthobacter rizhaonensis]
MRLLGVILAGGKSRRFGSDKARAMVAGKPLMQHAIDALATQTNELVISGHSWPGMVSIEDKPKPDLGPLGGLNAALSYAAKNGFDAVLSLPVDVYPIPSDLTDRLAAESPRFLVRHFATGCWPASLASLLDQHLSEGNRSVRSWIERCGAKPIEFRNDRISNINRPEDIP